jgi:hypothetical protein
MRFLIVLGLVALVSCSKDKDKKHEPPTITHANCYTAASMTCEDYDSTSQQYFRNRAKDCAQIGGKWSELSCPTSGLLGSCQETTATFTRTRRYYVGTPADISRTKVECGAFGKWLEPAASPQPQ